MPALASPGRPTEGHGRHSDSVTVAAGGPGRRGPATRAGQRRGVTASRAGRNYNLDFKATVPSSAN